MQENGPERAVLRSRAREGAREALATARYARSDRSRLPR